MSDPRIDPLPRSAVLTDTRYRIAFAPHDPEAKVTALEATVPADKMLQMQSLMQLGKVHLQVKSGFGDERTVELTGPELFIFMDLADRFVTELPRAQAAKVVE